MEPVIAIAAATAGWFVLAGASFFNPVVDPIYRSEEGHPAVRSLPQGPATIGKILTAVIIQCVIWAGIYALVRPALSDELWTRGLQFAGIIVGMKIIPRDVDRVLLTTYPTKRMVIEFVVGILCAVPVGVAFAALM